MHVLRTRVHQLLVRGRPMSSASEDGYPSRRELPQEDALTSRQLKIIQAILESLDHRGYPPSLREIGQAAGLKSTSAVSHQLSVLEAKGILHRDPGRPRALEILLPARSRAKAFDDTAINVLPQDTVPVPLIGRIAAGPPILAEENIEDILPLPSWLVPRSGELFLLRVVGDSMIGAAIADG